MNIFVLGTGRCGTTTFIKACGHVSNFTAGHETNINLYGLERLRFSDNHIEADNRLSWMLGRLEECYGQGAHYIHLKRDTDAVARSYLRRWNSEHSIIYGYRTTILPNPEADADPISIVRDMCETIDKNIAHFLRDKPHTSFMRLETAEEDFSRLWRELGFEGNLEAALGEWSVAHNSSVAKSSSVLGQATRIPAKVRRLVAKFPDFLRRA